MLNWKKKQTATISRTRWSCTITSDGIVWQAQEQGGMTCSDEAASALEQLASDELITAINGAFKASWDQVFALLRNGDYPGISADLAIPVVAHVVPSLSSVGTLTDSDFGIVVGEWVGENGLPMVIEVADGPVFSVDGRDRLMPHATWTVYEMVTQFWRRDEVDRSPDRNREHWGRIRQGAVRAGCPLSDFLYRSVVVTPEKLRLDLTRVDVGDIKVVEVMPTFEGCPEGWLAAYDRSPAVMNRYDIATHKGICQVVISPQVGAVLGQIKRMGLGGSRRLAGARAEAFVLNPFAALGEDAGQTIDSEHFEQAKATAGLTFDRFSAHIERNAGGHPVRVGLTIHAASQGIATNDKSRIAYFDDDPDLEQFIARAEQRITDGLQICPWRDYEFELLGDSSLELATLKTALGARRQGYIEITLEQIYDLSAYAARVEDIGVQRTTYSPFIAKIKDGDGWFPDNVVPVIHVSPADGSEPFSVPVAPGLETFMREQIAKAETDGRNCISIPQVPQAIPLTDARRIIEAFDGFRKEPQGTPPASQQAETPRTGERPPLLVLRTNISAVDYEEERRGFLVEEKHWQRVLPSSLRSDCKLMPHQLDGLAWLQRLFDASPSNCRGCILADDMGLGKTLQLLSLLAWAFERDALLGPALIVAPVSLLDNWQAEAKRFFDACALPMTVAYGDALKVLRVSKSAIDQQLLDKNLIKFLRPGWVGNAKIVLTTYETLRDLEFSFAREKWSVMICDEAQKIKNPDALVTRAAKKQSVRFRIACTGTPVENSLADLWCLFDFVQPGMLGALNEFGTRYRRPIEAKTEEQKARVEELRTKIDQQILRRTKAEVATQLKRKIVNDSCRALPMSAYQATLYSQALATFQLRDENQSGAFRNHLGLLHYLRQLCTAPRPVGTTASAIVPLAEYRQRSPKLDWLIRQLMAIRADGEKAIVFCEFKDVQRQLRTYIEQAFGTAPDIINGDTSTSSGSLSSRQNRLLAFQEKHGFGVIILSPLAVGFGVNIQAANHVIHYTRTWNPAKEDQATDRAYRIGQKKDVHVYYPVVKASGYRSFEEVLDELLRKKREIAKDMLNGAGDVLPNEFDVRAIAPANKDSVASVPIGDTELHTLHWKYFEALTEALWRARGFDVVYRTPEVGDGGVDVVAINGSHGALIQCKSSSIVGGAVTWDAIKDVVTGHAGYRDRHPGVQFELICMTNKRFNAGAIAQAQLNRVTLIDAAQVKSMLERNPITLDDLERSLQTSWNDPSVAQL